MTKTRGRPAARRLRQAERRRAEQRQDQQRQAEQRQAEQRRRRLLVRGGISLGALLAATGLVLLITGPLSSTQPPSTTPPPSAVTAAPVANGYGATVAPPWSAPPDPGPGMRAAGLPISDMSAMVQHFHAHLDVIVNGQPVPVPADLGVNSSSGDMSALHTHNDTGLVHIESSDPGGHYILGQLFNEWNVALDATRLGALTVGPGTSLRTFVDGVEAPGNPAALALREHQQIALVYGPANAPATAPASYDFSGA